jgi:hypothetical protein
MARRMCLEVPGLVDAYAVTLLNEALGTIEDFQMWSFQLKTSGWLTPGLLFPGGAGVSLGTITPVGNMPTVIGDAVASAQWQAYIAASQLPLFTQLQIRSPFYSLYNIIGVATNGGITTLTLDRPWTDPIGTQGYMIYQAYFPVPVTDFKRFLSARDTTNNYPMDYWTKSQKDLAVEDPERTIFNDPNYIVPFEQDQRPNSATFGNMLYELWPHPLSVLPYTFQYLRRGPTLTQPADTVPYPLTEDLVIWKAKEAAFLFKEAQKGEDMQRGQGANWQFLAEAAYAKYEKRLKPIKDRDRDLCELYWSKFRRDSYNSGEPFANINGSLNVGTM